MPTKEDKVPKKEIKAKAASSTGKGLMSMISKMQDVTRYRELNWEGSLDEYLSVVQKDSKVCRTAYQRIYDMIMAHGFEEYIEYKKRIKKYNFFNDPFDNGKDAVFGLDVHLMKLLNAFRSAARRYGTEKRILLLHGPVGSAKSTVVRLLKKGLETYSKTPEGALYSYSWIKKGITDNKKIFG